MEATRLKTYEKIILKDLLALREEVSLFSNEQDLWKKLPGTNNSAGHLTVHLIGNLNHFMAHGLGQLDYVRDRESEFTTSPISREELLGQIDALHAFLSRMFPSLDDQLLEKDFPLPWRADTYYNSLFMLTQLSVHLSYHLGQINYHRRYFNAID